MTYAELSNLADAAQAAYDANPTNVNSVALYHADGAAAEADVLEAKAAAAARLAANVARMAAADAKLDATRAALPRFPRMKPETLARRAAARAAARIVYVADLLARLDAHGDDGFYSEMAAEMRARLAVSA